MPYGRLLITAFAPQDCNLEALAGMVSRHWSKHAFGATRQEVGLGSCEARNTTDYMHYAMTRP